jgi:hypothetical protein
MSTPWARFGLVTAIAVLAIAGPGVASARTVATARLPGSFTEYDEFAGPVLLAGAPVWAQHDADGRWRIYRAGARTSRLGTLPAVGVKHYFHPVSLSASASWLTVDNSAAFVQDGVDDRRVDRLLVVRVGHHLTQLVGCGYGASSCDSPSVCQPLYGPTQSGWSASTGGGTLA